MLDAEEVWNAAGLFKRDPITVVHEGLFQFLTLSERKRSRVFEPQVLERIEYEEVWVMRLIN